MEQLGVGLLLFFCTLGFTYGEIPPYPLSDDDLLVAGGYYDESGKYLGGIPEFYETKEISECTSFNATVCLEWESKDSEDDLEYEVCNCNLNGADDYCPNWTCSMVVANVDPACEDQCYFVTAVAIKNCECVLSDTTTFCAEWTCAEYPPNSAPEYEDYSCITAAESGEYCEAWTREVESPGVLQVAACSCMQAQDDGVCVNWECQERGIDKCGGVCDVRIAVGIGGTLGLVGLALLYVAVMDGGIICSVLLVLWVLAAATSVVYWGGQDGAVYVAIMWGIPIILKGICWFCRGKD